MSPNTLFDHPLIDDLNARYWAELGGLRANILSLRMRRALSWLTRASKEKDDPDTVFALCWIAFNALYVEYHPSWQGHQEQQSFEAYFSKILQLDTEKAITRAIWSKFSGPIQSLLDNQYVYKHFWSHYNGVTGFQNWRRWLENDRRQVRADIADGGIEVALTKMFDRLYVLRNQIIHGGATWKSSVNRRQVEDGAAIMAFLLPLFIKLMMDNPNEDWGSKPYYPSTDFDP